MVPEQPAVFFDRDGTIIREVNYCGNPSQVHAFVGAAGALVKLQQAGFALIIVTNQSGIGRGYFTREDFESVQDEVLRQIKPAEILATYYDDSTPDRPSDRRKPSPRMVFEAAICRARSSSATKTPTSSAANAPGCARCWSRQATEKNTGTAGPMWWCRMSAMRPTGFCRRRDVQNNRHHTRAMGLDAFSRKAVGRAAGQAVGAACMGTRRPGAIG
jgi:histidinol-phosphate phosphatase family protein